MPPGNPQGYNDDEWEYEEVSAPTASTPASDDEDEWDYSTIAPNAPALTAPAAPTPSRPFQLTDLLSAKMPLGEWSHPSHRRSRMIENKMDIPEGALDPYSPDPTFGGHMLRSWDRHANFARGVGEVAHKTAQFASEDILGPDSVLGGPAMERTMAGLGFDPMQGPPSPPGPPPPPEILEPVERQGENNFLNATVPYLGGKLAGYMVPGTQLTKQAQLLGRAAEGAPMFSRFPKLAGFLARGSTEAAGGAAFGAIETDDPKYAALGAAAGFGGVALIDTARYVMAAKWAPEVIGALIRPTSKTMQRGADPVEAILREKIVATSFDDLGVQIESRIAGIEDDLRRTLADDPRVVHEAREVFRNTMLEAAADARTRGRTAVAKEIEKRMKAYDENFLPEAPSLNELLDFRRELGQDIRSWSDAEPAGVNIDKIMRKAYGAMDGVLYRNSPAAQQLSKRQHDLLAAKDAVDERAKKLVEETYARVGERLGSGSVGALIGSGVELSRAQSRGESVSYTDLLQNALIGATIGTVAGGTVGKFHRAMSTPAAATSRARLYRSMWPTLDPEVGLPIPAELTAGEMARNQARRGLGPEADIGDFPNPDHNVFFQPGDLPPPPPDRGMPEILRSADALPEGAAAKVGGLETEGMPLNRMSEVRTKAPQWDAPPIGERPALPAWAPPDAIGGESVREQARRGFGPMADIGDFPVDSPNFFKPGDLPPPPPNRGIDEVFETAAGLGKKPGRNVIKPETEGIPATAAPLTRKRPPTSYAPESTEGVAARNALAAGDGPPPPPGAPDGLSGPPSPPPTMAGPGAAKVGTSKGPFTADGKPIRSTSVVSGGRTRALASAEGKDGKFIIVRAEETAEGSGVYRLTRSADGAEPVEVGTFAGNERGARKAAERVLMGQPVEPPKAPVKNVKKAKKASKKAGEAGGSAGVGASAADAPPAPPASIADTAVDFKKQTGLNASDDLQKEIDEVIGSYNASIDSADDTPMSITSDEDLLTALDDIAGKDVANPNLYDAQTNAQAAKLKREIAKVRKQIEARRKGSGSTGTPTSSTSTDMVIGDLVTTPDGKTGRVVNVIDYPSGRFITIDGPAAGQFSAQSLKKAGGS